tara:strand:- start:239 stop:817 length:579 start_codon:yes stop_codon:yes gene_type:complete
MEKRLNQFMTQIALSNTLADDIRKEFNSLVHDFGPKALAIAYHYVGNKAAAQDVAQEAFMKAHRALNQFRGDSALSTWFFTILVREAKRYRKRQKRKQQILDLFRFSKPDDDETNLQEIDSIERNEIQKALANAIMHLSPNQRDVIILIYMQDLTVAETATILGKASGTIKSHMHRALEKLREELQDMEEIL